MADLISSPSRSREQMKESTNDEISSGKTSIYHLKVFFIFPSVIETMNPLLNEISTVSIGVCPDETLPVHETSNDECVSSIESHFRK